MSENYESIPLKGLRDSLGRVVNEVTSTGRPVVVTRDGEETVALVPAALLSAVGFPPAYFDEAERRAEIAHLTSKLDAQSPEAVADAEEWLQRFNAANGGDAAAGAA